MAGHIKKREWLDGRALPVDPARRAEQVRAIKAKAREEGRAVAPPRVTYQARIPTPGNRHKHDVKTFTRKKDAERWLSNEQAKRLTGAYIEPRRGDTPLAAVADEWKATWTDLEPKTCVGYESILQHHVLPEFGRSRVVAITPEAIQKWVNDLADRRAPNTVRRVMDVLRNVLRLAVERRYIAANPCDAVKMPKKGGRRRTIDIAPLTHAELDAIADRLPEHWRVPVYTAAYMGLRAGELWALRRDDVDLLRGTLRVDEAIKEVTTAAAVNVRESSRLSPSLITGPTKTHAVRTLPLPGGLRADLETHLAGPLPGGNDPRSFIFTTPTGEPVRHNLFYKRVFAPVAPTTRFHDLRHTCAAWLIESGAHPLAVMQYLGHEDIRTTMNVYGHMFPAGLDALAASLDAGYRRCEHVPAVAAVL